MRSAARKALGASESACEKIVIARNVGWAKRSVPTNCVKLSLIRLLMVGTLRFAHPTSLFYENVARLAFLSSPTHFVRSAAPISNFLLT